MDQGYYSKIKKKDSNVIKMYYFNKYKFAQKQVVDLCFNNHDYISVINEYLNRLNNAGIKMANITAMRKVDGNLFLKQDYISGEQLEAFLQRTASENYEQSLQKGLEYLGKLVQMLSNIHKNENFYVDFNLMNFVIDENDDLILVDLFPPLLKENLINAKHLPIQDQVDLFVYPEIQLISLISYFLKPYMKQIQLGNQAETQKKEAFSKLLQRVLSVAQKNCSEVLDLNQTVERITQNNEHVFLKRFYEIKKYMKQPDGVYQDFYEAYQKFSLAKKLEAVKGDEYVK